MIIYAKTILKDPYSCMDKALTNCLILKGKEMCKTSKLRNRTH